jgi:hypothetical protein
MSRTLLSWVNLLALAAATTVSAQIRLVDMVPNKRSGETNQDSEPTITVDPLNAAHMAGSAFTWDNLTQGPMVTSTAPIYVSADSGNTWALALVVPSKVGSGFPTADINLSFGGTASGATAHASSSLYGGTLSAAVLSYPVQVLRGQDPYSAALMTVLDTQSGNVDQPHTSARSSGAGEDKLFVGFNHGYGCIVSSGRTSTIDDSQDAKIATPVFATAVIEARDTPCQDGFAQVPAPHRDGTVYAAFIHDWSGSPRMVVVRDDNWASGATPFQALLDPSDNKPGRFIAPAMTLPAGSMGQNRLGASNVSIAVDPNDSDRVYVAWGDSGGSNTETIHVRRSVNRGVDWSASDLLTMTNTMNPEIAITGMGVVGVLYQRVISGRWETRLVRTKDPDATTFDKPGVLLANQAASTPVSTYDPYIGDYASLVSSGRNFVGMFSASNYPDKAKFIKGVKYQREVNWASHKLFSDAAHTTEVSPSIDPFFFEADWSICDSIPGVCSICRRFPEACYGIYDPWWKFKCPQCGLQILIDPGDEFTKVVLYDDRGRQVGTFARLKEPVEIKGVRYTYGLNMKAREGASYVMKAVSRNGVRPKSSFNPAHTVRVIERE